MPKSQRKQTAPARAARLAAVLCAALLLSCFVIACQPTPEGDIVVNKSEDILDVVASQPPVKSGSKLSDRTFPERYTYEAHSESELLNLYVDAPVVLPASGKLPVATMETGRFSQEAAKGMVRYLYPDALPTDTHYVMTKSDIEHAILDYRKEVEKWRASTETYAADMVAQYEGFIADLEAQYEAAPEERPPETTTDGAYVDNGKGGQRLDCSAEGRGFLFVVAGGTGVHEEAQLWYCNSNTNFVIDGAPEVAQSYAPGPEYRGKLSLPAAEAVKLAQGFLSACGRDDIVLANIYIADNHGTGHVDDYYGPATQYAYKLFFTPTVNGTAVAVHANHGARTYDEYDIPWMPEWIEFLVGDKGILEIQWREPGKVTGIVNEDADIIPFEDAVRRFEANIFQTYAPWCSEEENEYEKDKHMDITISEIRLGLMRVKQKDKIGQKLGVYVPAYLFYGDALQSWTFKTNGKAYKSYRNASSDLFVGPTLVIAINAIDGSVIDIMGSY